MQYLDPVDVWESLRTFAHNMLLEGPTAATEAALRLIPANRREQVVWAGSETLGGLNAARHTIILRNVDALGGDDQQRLLEWLGTTPSRTQIISTAARPLFARVEAGLFDEALYYRLNVVRLRF